MQAFWTEYGFYLWGLTTALAIIALAWLGWNTFAQPDSEPGSSDAAGADLQPLMVQVQELSESAPLMRASLGRALQFVGVERYGDAAGAPAFALAVANARGDGFVLMSSARGGLTVKPLAAWGASARTPFGAEEQAAIRQARTQLEQSA